MALIETRDLWKTYQMGDEQIHALRRAYRLLFAGRVSPEKGVHDLVEAFNTIESALPGLQLHLVGSINSLPKEFIVQLSREPLCLSPRTWSIVFIPFSKI